jgi:hypothetical protein
VLWLAQAGGYAEDEARGVGVDPTTGGVVVGGQVIGGAHGVGHGERPGAWRRSRLQAGRGRRSRSIRGHGVYVQAATEP